MLAKPHQPRVFLLGDARYQGRTIRSLATTGVVSTSIDALSAGLLREILRDGGPILFVRCGAWFAQAIEFPPPSATGKGLCALGSVRAPRETDQATLQSAASWSQWLTRTGGHLEGTEDVEIPDPVVLYLDAIAAAALVDSGAATLAELVRAAAGHCRLVHYAPLDAFVDLGLRVLQVITALQRGGAERVTLDLLAELPGLGVRARLLTLGRALREAFPTPAGALELSQIKGPRETRGEAVLRLARAFGADVVHAHLINGDDVRFLSEAGFPVVLTLHNMRCGWQPGVAELRRKDVALLAACAQTIESDAVGIDGPVRVAWNGINFNEFTLTAELAAAGRQLRAQWGFGETDFVLVALANPRPQKRIDLLPAVLSALRHGLQRLSNPVEARLVISGETANGNAEAAECIARTKKEIERLGLGAHVRWIGSAAEPAKVLAAADVLLSTSAHEGLSLAQLEALAMGCPVVATDVGGAREIARDTDALYLVPVDASPEDFARHLVELASRARPQHNLLTRSNELTSRPVNESSSWSRKRMAERYWRLYPRAIAAWDRGGKGWGIWLVTNNFSTGGAQSSARRLLVGMAAKGVRVRAAVVEENPDNPTPGRSALVNAGIPVVAIDSTAGGFEPLDALLRAIDADPPEAVLFWNLRPAFKVGLADALLDIPVFDVSPGEMLFDSLDKYFARPHPGFPYRTARDYGRRLRGVIVKYHAEAPRAAEVLGAPVHVIPNGVPLGEPRSWQRDRQRLVFGTAARINPQKRFEDLIEAFRLAHDRLPAYTLKIAGGIEPGCDDYAARLKAQAAGLPVEWLGDVADVGAFHRDLDIFVMISEPAGCPNASLEAMASGLPVIATDVGGASEQVVNGVTGLLVPARDPKAFSEALVGLAGNSKLRRGLGENAQGLVARRFGVDRMVDDYIGVCLGSSGWWGTTFGQSGCRGFEVIQNATFSAVPFGTWVSFEATQP